MSLKRFLMSGLVFGGLFIAGQGCLVDDAGSSEDRICTPGANVFCRCADRAKGTKLCLDDGKSFGTCSTNADRSECEEIEDPNSGKPVDPDGNPIDEPDGGPGPSPRSIDSCPGKSTSLTPGVTATVDGDTSDAADDAKGKTGACAAGAGGPDHVYQVIPTGTGSLSIKVQGSGAFNPTVYLRSTCDDENSQISCAEQTGTGGLEQLKTNVITGNSYFLFVDGASGSAGKYKLTMELTTGSFCGDGDVGPGEACDDKNHVDDDGCSPDCRKVNGDPASGNGCPGHEVHVWSGSTVTGTGSTVSYGNTWTDTGSSCTVKEGLNVAQEHVYQVVPHASGTLTVTASPKDTTFNLMLVARSNCDDESTQVDCANSFGSGSTSAEKIQVPVTSGKKVYVAVDGVLNGKGDYDITFKIQ